jgi:hypothetical protein
MEKTNNIARSRRVTVIELLRLLSADFFDPYRPELHYMRGPGPKWRAKHQAVTDRSICVTSAPARVQGTYRLA